MHHLPGQAAQGIGVATEYRQGFDRLIEELVGFFLSARQTQRADIG